MKVSGINNIVFNGSSVQKTYTDNVVSQKTQREIKELGYVTPNFNVNIPVNYRKTSTDKLDNGLELHNYKMANGYKVTIVPMKNSPAVVKSYVNVGSMNETADIKDRIAP